MCCGCWKEDGSPQIDNERVRDVQALIAAVYDYHGAGGNLHIVLDDNNTEDEHLEFCQGQINKARITGEDEWGYDSSEALDAEQKCLDALRAMTLEERDSAMGLWDGCWS